MEVSQKNQQLLYREKLTMRFIALSALSFGSIPIFLFLFVSPLILKLNTFFSDIPLVIGSLLGFIAIGLFYVPNSKKHLSCFKPLDFQVLTITYKYRFIASLTILVCGLYSVILGYVFLFIENIILLTPEEIILSYSTSLVLMYDICAILGSILLIGSVILSIFNMWRYKRITASEKIILDDTITSTK